MIYRLYFNRCEDFPQIWSIDEGTPDTEITVSGFEIAAGCTSRGGRAPDFSALTSRDPKAWVEVDASFLRIDKGVAVFS